MAALRSSEAPDAPPPLSLHSPTVTSPCRSCPFYNGRESEHWAAAEKMKEDIAKLEKKAYLRWQEAGN